MSKQVTRRTAGAEAAQKSEAHDDGARSAHTAARNQAASLTELYRQHRSAIRAFCSARLRSNELGEDAAQETFARLLATDTGSIANPRAWLYTVARNVCTDIQRDRQREVLGGSLGDTPALEISRDAADEARTAQETRNGLIALKRLRPRYRAALILREIHGVPVHDVAESLGISEGAAHTVLSRARDSFARTYAEISGRPEACMDALALAFRRESTSLSSADTDRLEFHLASCPWCRAQTETGSNARLAMLVPLFGPPPGSPFGPLQGLLHRIGRLSAPLEGSARHVLPLGEQATQVVTRVFAPLLLAVAISAPPSVPPDLSRVPDRALATAEQSTGTRQMPEVSRSGSSPEAGTSNTANRNGACGTEVVGEPDPGHDQAARGDDSGHRGNAGSDTGAQGSQVQIGPAQGKGAPAAPTRGPRYAVSAGSDTGSGATETERDGGNGSQGGSDSGAETDVPGADAPQGEEGRGERSQGTSAHSGAKG